MPEETAISAITLAEMATGPGATSDAAEQDRRQDRLHWAAAHWDPFPFDDEAARAYGRIFAAKGRLGGAFSWVRGVCLPSADNNPAIRPLTNYWPHYRQADETPAHPGTAPPQRRRISLHRGGQAPVMRVWDLSDIPATNVGAKGTPPTPPSAPVADRTGRCAHGRPPPRWGNRNLSFGRGPVPTGYRPAGAHARTGSPPRRDLYRDLTNRCTRTHRLAHREGHIPDSGGDVGARPREHRPPAPTLARRAPVRRSG